MNNVFTMKISKEQWKYEVTRAIRIREDNKKKLRKHKYKYYDKVLSKYMPLPFIIGFICIILLIIIYGWSEFFKFLLAWIVNLTIIAAIAFYIWRHVEDKL